MGRVSHIDRPKTAYRGVDRLSYSALSDFSKNRRSFYKKYILKEDVKEEDSEFLLRGQLVDILKTDRENFDNYFVITKAPHPAPQMKTFCEHLFNIRVKSPDISFADCTKDAYKLLAENNIDKKTGKLLKLSTGYETYIEKFAKDGVEYFEELLSGVGKTLVSIEDVTIANNIVRKSENCEAFKQRGNRVLTKVPILFKYGDWELKCEVDEIDIDDDGQVIYPIDYKMSSYIDTFAMKGFLGNNYYIQSGLYKFAIESKWKHDNGMANYKVENMAFKVMDQADWYDPLLYKTTDEHYEQAFTGFYAGTRYYKGIDQLLDEIAYHTDADNWSMSVDNIKNDGTVYIPSFKRERSDV